MQELIAYLTDIVSSYEQHIGFWHLLTFCLLLPTLTSFGYLANHGLQSYITEYTESDKKEINHFGLKF
ncbi:MULTISPECIES: hypothetical protein [Vibrio]|uniref:hypothetical protein n=1 Tax=Vibrio TaxID=662 RepID=UPI0008419096|nr:MULTISPECIES: hypothetical protein [Vibrio]ODM55872.1 hypothetical protein BC455_23365 [Vibrio harveyi]USD58567.1 hypothetical protein J4N44_26815 [Vibrio sp. SCSIO 43155]